MASTRDIQELPLELLGMVAEKLRVPYVKDEEFRRDIINFRLVSRKFRDSSWPSFGKQCFSRREVLFRPGHIQHLLDISQNPHLAAHVEELDFLLDVSPVDWCISAWDDAVLHPKDMAVRFISWIGADVMTKELEEELKPHWGKDFLAFLTCFFKYVMRFPESQQDLTAALSRFPKLRSVDISQTPAWHSVTFLDWSAGFRQKIDKLVQHHLTQAFEMVVRGLSNSRVSLNRLCFSFQVEGCQPLASMTAHTISDIQTILQPVSKLEFNIEEEEFGSPPLDGWKDWVATCMRSAPRLQSLILSFSNWDRAGQQHHRDILQQLLSDIRLDELSSIELFCVSTTETDLAWLLTKFGPQLKALSFKLLTLDEGTWSSVASRLRVFCPRLEAVVFFEVIEGPYSPYWPSTRAEIEAAFTNQRDLKVSYRTGELDGSL